ncbi:hypothetical protein KUTeg_008501 [Tegillarca granosa]|uniref:Uncharacterized protein n=1 Tax=Tegillarca granosa TaxID=220873 RepID=A0ABQ9F9C9_TEGGR|nr:hypothetical protein KUTeg_008501 [Tegillarca granosa]
MCMESLHAREPGRHKSFRLRLPSIRREFQSRTRIIDTSKDPENPPIPEESVPLSHLPIPDMQLPPNSPPLRQKAWDGLLPDVATESEKGSSLSYMRRASSLEELDSTQREMYQESTDKEYTGYSTYVTNIFIGPDDDQSDRL